MEWIYKIIQFFIRQWIAFHSTRSGATTKIGQVHHSMVKTRRRVPSDSPNPEDELIDGIRDNKCDDLTTLNFYGVDQKNNFLFVKISHLRDKHAELVLFLGLEDGRMYELPDHPNTVINSNGKSGWSAAGLKVDVLESAKRTRIVFNGLLRKGIRKNVGEDGDADCIEHVRLNCIFIACSQPYQRKEFWNANVQAETLAQNLCKAFKWPDLINNAGADQVNQYGSIMSQLTFEDSSNQELRLRGSRQYLWGKRDADRLDRNVCVTGLDVLGNAFCVNALDVRGGLKNVRLGHLKDPMEVLHPIQSLIFNMSRFLDRYESGFNEYEFQFIANNKMYEFVVKFDRNNERTLYGGYPWDFQYQFCPFEMRFNDTLGAGMIEIYQPYIGPCPIRSPLFKKVIEAKEPNENYVVHTLPFDDERCRNENFVGGKGASLAELTSIDSEQFTVPEGFCVTAHALEAHIKYHENLTEAIDEFAKICGEGNVKIIKEHSQKVVQLLEDTAVLHTVQVEILKELKRLETIDGENRYAIRSSAVGEDSEDTSAAGQNSTFLGVKDADDVLKFVARCWASLYSYQSAEYRRQNGMPIKAAMGVCVQKMVNAEAAGIMFTRHPITGNPKEILITSNYGIGESVVSALVDPDTIIVYRSHTDALSIQTSKIGKKSQKIIIDREIGGTICSNLSATESSTLSISADLVLKLGEIGASLDEHYGAPRDIEWAVVDGHVYLLQCRPVTALDTWTDFELTHELGSGTPAESDILTFANVGEVLPMVLTPLTISTIIHALNIGTETNVSRKRILHTYSNHQFIVNMRSTLNFSNIVLRQIGKKINMFNRVTEIAVCGHTFVTPEIHDLALKRNGVTPGSVQLQLFCGMLKDLWYNSSKVDRSRRIVERYRSNLVELEQCTSTRKLHDKLNVMIEDLAEVGIDHSHSSKCSIFYQALTMIILTEGKEEFTMEHYSDIAVLLGSCSDVVSAQVPLELKKITQTIRASGMAEQFKGVESSEAINWLRSNCPRAYEQVRDFIRLHGYRGIEEFELMTETWGMRPEKFLSTVQSMIDTSSDHGTKPVGELSPAESVSQLQTPKKSSTRWLIGKLLPATRRAVAYREQTKALLIELVHMMRLAYRRLALLLKRQGRLPDESLVFFLTHAELAEMLERPCPSLVRKATRRARIRPRLQKYKYKEVHFGMPMPMEVSHLESAAHGGAKVQGTSVCNGVVTARACVALNLEEATAIRPGDILITNATDIGWSPYFPLLGGVVTELGGIISHGAVIAREYGLPCIVSAEDATRIFKTGETVTLNGFAGTIEAVKTKEEAN